jgi:hypothetical protein
VCFALGSAFPPGKLATTMDHCISFLSSSNSWQLSWSRCAFGWISLKSHHSLLRIRGIWEW